MTSLEAAVPAAATLFLVPPRADRLDMGRRLIGPFVSDRAQDHALARRGLHPDVMELLPPGGKEKIGIDQVREVIRMGQFSAAQADRKACLAPFAEDLTPEASNALLKTLEEPTRGMVFVLLSEHTGDVLPTIVSRSRVERVQPESRRELAARLVAAGYSNSEAGWLVRAATRRGELAALAAAPAPLDQTRAQARERLTAASAGDLVVACMDGGPVDRREALDLLAERAAARDPELLTTGVSSLAGQERATIFVFLGELLAACADALRDHVAAGTEAPQSGVLSAGQLARACEKIESANRALLAYAPTEGVLVSLFLAFGGERRGA